MVRFFPTFELALNADLTASPSSWSWTDYTNKVRNPSTISVTRGKSGRYTQAPPATLGAELINTGGLFVPSNPQSELYGLIDINTPCRYSQRPATNSASDTFTRTASSSWGTATTGGAWTVVGTASDFSVSSTFARVTNTAANAPRYAVLAASMLRSDITVRVRVNALSTGAPQTVACVSRYASSSAANRVELRFGTDQTLSLRIVQRVGGVDSLGTAVTVSGLTHTAANWYWLRVQVGKTSVRAKAWADGSTQPRGWHLDGSNGVATSNASAGQCGLFAMRETSNTNANATMDFDDYTLVDGPRIQFTGLVDEWPTTWADASGKQSFARISVQGQLGRVSQLPALRSPLYRAYTIGSYGSAPDTVGYWPMEDKGVSRSFGSGIGGAAMTMSGFQPAQDSGFAGSDALPTMRTGGGNFTAAVRAYTSPSPNEWAVHVVGKFPTAASANTAVITVASGGTISRWVIAITVGAPDVVKFQGFTGPSNATEVLGSAGVNFVDTAGAELYNKNLHFAVTATQNGANIDWTFAVTFLDTNGLPAQLSSAGSVAGTLGNVSRVYHVSTNGFTAGGYTMGHAAVGRNAGFGPTGADAITAYDGESTTDRFARLCAEADVSGLVGDITTGTLGSSVQMMGPQTSGTLEGQLREIESTEEGLLFDGKQGQLTLLPRSMRRNHAVNLTLDVSAGEVGWPFAAATDTLAFRNDATATSPNGSSARAIATGDLAPSAVGAYTDPVTVNAPDVDLPDHANWRMRLGTARDPRYPQLVINLARSPQLIEQILDLDVGGRIAVSNLPGVLDPTPLDLLVDGYTEVASRTSWIVTLTCSPASPWDAFTWGSTSGNLGRHDTQGSYLMAGYTSADTTMRLASVASPYGLANTPMWSTTGEPYDVGVAGERIRVDTMTTSAGAFVATGTAAHGNNASLAPGMPAGIQKGDLLLVLAAIRNTAATANSVSSPGGWTRLVDGGNVCLYGQLWDGSFTAPTVGFSGGSAGDTTSAQMAAFRYTQNVQAGPAPTVQSNVAAANIAVSGVEARRQRCVVIAVGWRQSNWTSVAAMGSWTEIGDTSSALGSTQGIVWDYQVMSGTTTNFGGNSFAVTGGVNAISKSFMVALAADVQEATVTRSRNGVVKPQTAAAAVSLWRPGRIAL